MPDAPFMIAMPSFDPPLMVASLFKSKVILLATGFA
eukprot:CAMPEP_0203942374 /NCGR_PEP_ID=MMETSP0359-20131031/78577_1 /ASSEMBLY_ACC=CAM_ASM_000338 /TAXON_ID=268821 /ORGANISM="Scrippsiella Hangoei, Strain SHTV-5" /LENGTH=35 /DNA_ID= /DNA_START= /DNA_END= /DNA_ORIENTATION=